MNTPPNLPPARDRVGPINDRLAPLYPQFKGLNYSNPLELLVAVILSAQCTDARINTLTPALFARFPTARDFAECDIGELERLVKPRRRDSRPTCVSTVIPGVSNAWPRTTFAVLRPTPGSVTRSSSVVGTSPLNRVTISTHAARMFLALFL